MVVRLFLLLVLSIGLLSACDQTSTTHYTQCYQEQTGDVVYERCCETKCKYDDDCYDSWGGDCDVDCTETCYNTASTPVATVVYVTPGQTPPPPRTPTPTPE